MIDREIELQTKDGVMNTFVTHPEEEGPPSGYSASYGCAR